MAQPVNTSPGYEIQAELGRGTTGVVYRARQVALNRVVALKLPLLSPAAERPRRSAQFLREARALAALTCEPDPDIPSLYEVGEVKGQPYYAREFVEGSDLEAMIRVGSICLREGITAVSAVTRAIHRVHCRGLGHRNLHPGNVLIGTGGTAKLIGFGLVGMLVAPRVAPAGAAGPSVDIDLKALGGLLAWLCSGVRQAVPARLAAICGRCSLAASAGGYADAAGLADELGGCLVDEHLA